MSTSKVLIRGLAPEQLRNLARELGHQSFRGQQLAQWLYSHEVDTWDDLHNLPGSLRQRLATDYDLNGLRLQERQVAGDGTRKFLFALRDGETVESVIIPMDRHATFCLSSQVGCAMACSFCATARGGRVRDLNSGEIVEQVLRLRDDLKREPMPGHGGRQFNLVFMGMGEPLDNWDEVQAAIDIFVASDGLAMSPRRIQISTSGPAHGLARLAECRHPVGLTVSLGGTDDAERKRSMPVPGRTGLAEVLAAAEQYARQTGRKVTLAYVLIAGVSDKLEQAQRLAALTRGRNFKINLIPLNRLDDDPLRPADAASTLSFQKVLGEAGIDTFIRASGGQDIAAACGQLRRRRQRRNDPASS